MANATMNPAKNKFVEFNATNDKYIVDTGYLEFLELQFLQTVRCRENQVVMMNKGMIYEIKNHYSSILNEEKQYEEEFIRYYKHIKLLD